MSQTYFDTIKKSYADVPVSSDGVETSSFLEATEGLIKLFDLLGSSAFTVVQNDMNGNVKKIRERLLARPMQADTLEHLVLDEAKEKNRTATGGLLWLNRGLSFTSQALRRSIDNPTEELSVSFTKAYEGTLRQYHSFVVRPVFSLAMKACPYRKDFYAKLGTDQAKVKLQLEEWLSALEKITAQLDSFYKGGNHAKGL